MSLIVRNQRELHTKKKEAIFTYGIGKNTDKIIMGILLRPILPD